MYNFKCPIALFIYGDLVKRSSPRYLAYISKKKNEEARKKEKARKAALNADPFKNKKQRAIDLAKAEAEFEARVAIHAATLND